MKVNVIDSSDGREEPKKSLVPVGITQLDAIYTSIGVICLMYLTSLVPSIDGQDDLGPCVNCPLGEATHTAEEIDDHDWLLQFNDPLWFPVFFFMWKKAMGFAQCLQFPSPSAMWSYSHLVRQHLHQSSVAITIPPGILKHISQTLLHRDYRSSNRSLDIQPQNQTKGRL